MKKQPDKRFQSGEEFAQALQSASPASSTRKAEKKGSARGIPMAVRWALTMAAVVAITMTMTATVLYKQQYAAMMDQVKDYGGSLAKFTATQNAVPLLSEDWAAMDVFVQEALGRQQNFSYMNVVDHQGIVRASNVAADVNKQYVAPQRPSPVPSKDPGVTVQSLRMPDGRQVLDFSAPVLFQGKTIGTVHLGIYEAPLTAVANLVLVLLAILTIVTVAAVAGGTYLLAQRLAVPIRVLKNSLGELANGRYDYRIAETRKDEFGELYAEFDKTAAALEKRHEPPARCDGRRTAPMAADVRRARLACARARARPCRLRDTRRRPRPRPAPVVVVAGGRRARARTRRRLRDGHRRGRRHAGLAGAALLGRRERAWWIAQFNNVTSVRPGQIVVVPLRMRNRDRRLRQRLPDGADPLLSPLRHEVEQAQRHGRGVRSADGLPRAQRLHGHHVAAARALPRRQGSAAGEVGRDHHRRRLPLHVRDRVPDPAQVRLSRHGLPVHGLRRRVRRDDVGPDEGDDGAAHLIEIQPHSKSHANLTLKLPGETDARYRERIRREVDAPVATLRDRLADPSFTYAYPYGDVNEYVVDLLVKQNVAQGVTVTPGGNPFYAYPYMLRRSMIFGNEDLDAFKAKLVTFVRTASR